MTLSTRELCGIEAVFFLLDEGRQRPEKLSCHNCHFDSPNYFDSVAG